MAQKRMLDKKISTSEKVADLPLVAQLIFSWSIPHADDAGLLPFSLKSLRAMIVPLMDIRLEDFGNHVESIVKTDLWMEVEVRGDKFYKIKNFLQHQTLKRDRKPQTLAKDITNWDQVESIGIQMEPKRSELSKGREVSSDRKKSGMDQVRDILKANGKEHLTKQNGK